MISMTVPVVWRAKQKQLFYLVKLLQRIHIAWLIKLCIAKPPATPLSSMRDHLPPPTVIITAPSMIIDNLLKISGTIFMIPSHKEFDKIEMYSNGWLI
ncbi:hypothetical protein P8452_51584 [Trifolium repens]|nr:hypothetical protein P8452_51584 [Trifolium repens]